MIDLIDNEVAIQEQIAKKQEQFELLAALKLVAIGGGCGAASLD